MTAYLAALAPIIFGTTYLLTSDFLPPDRPLLAALMRSLPTGLVLIIGTRPPNRRWLFRLAAPYVTTFAADTSMIVANAKAKAELGWKPEFPTYREGIAAASAEDHTSGPAAAA